MPNTVTTGPRLGHPRSPDRPAPRPALATREGAASRGRTFRPSRILWSNFVGIGIMHLGCILAPFYFSWSAVGVAAVLWWMAGGLGVCLCYHRLLTHRSFRTPKVVEYFLTILGTLNWQGGPIRWVGGHRLHHKHSDTDDDPHTPHHGFNWSHVLWTMTKDPPGHEPSAAARDLQRDPVHVIIDRFHFVWQIFLAIGLFFAGKAVGGTNVGIAWVVWGCCVRTVFTYHATWFVNSAAHTWGYRSHDTTDDSRNNWWVAILSFGEGWHNNHHAHQRAAAHGRRWWELDLTYLTIRAMWLLGLASEIVPAGPGSPLEPRTHAGRSRRPG